VLLHGTGHPPLSAPRPPAWLCQPARLSVQACDAAMHASPQEDYIKEEQRNLKRELLRAQEEVKRIQAVPLVIGQFMEAVDGTSGIVGSTTGSNYYVRAATYVLCDRPARGRPCCASCCQLVRVMLLRPITPSSAKGSSQLAFERKAPCMSSVLSVSM